MKIEDPFTGGEDGFDDLLQTGQLARSTGERLAVVVVGRRVVADLFQRCDRGQDRSLLAFGVRVGRLRDETVEHSLIETDLLRCHRAVVEFVDLVGQLRGDFRLGLCAAEDENSVQRPQRGVTFAGHLGDECRARAEQTRVGEIEDRPEVAEAVLDRGAGERDTAARVDAAELLG